MTNNPRQKLQLEISQLHKEKPHNNSSFLSQKSWIICHEGYQWPDPHPEHKIVQIWFKMFFKKGQRWMKLGELHRGTGNGDNDERWLWTKVKVSLGWLIMMAQVGHSLLYMIRGTLREGYESENVHGCLWWEDQRDLLTWCILPGAPLTLASLGNISRSLSMSLNVFAKTIKHSHKIWLLCELN